MAKLAAELGITYNEETHKKYKDSLRSKKLEVKSLKQALSDENVNILTAGINFYDDDYSLMSVIQQENYRENKIEKAEDNIKQYLDTFIEIAGKDEFVGDVCAQKDENGYFDELTIAIDSKRVDSHFAPLRSVTL